MDLAGRCAGGLRALAAAALLAVVPGAMGQDDAALRAYYTGNGLLQRGLYELAVPEYRTFLQEHGEHEKAPIARYGLAVSLFRLERLAEAAEQLDLILGDDSFQFAAESLLLRGHCHLSAGEFEKAAERFEGLLNRHGSHESAGDAAALLAEARYRAGRLDRVDEAVAYLVANHPANSRRDRAELLGGLAAVGRGDFSGGAARFEALLKRSSRGTYADQASLLLAQALHRLGRGEEAAAWYRDAMGREGSAYAADARLGLAHLSYSRGELERARGLLDEVLRAGEPRARLDEARLLRARVAFDENDDDMAQRLLGALRESGGEAWRDDATYWLAKIMLRREDPAAAAALLAEVVERFEGSELIGEAMFDLGVALHRAGDREGALEAYRAFGERFASHALAPVSLRARASILHELGEYDASLALCEEYLAAYGSSAEAPEIEFLAGENEFLGGRHERAAARYERLVEAGEAIDGALLERATFRLGMALVRLDRIDEARGLLEKVTEGERTREVFLPALFALGEGLFARGLWRESEEAFQGYLSADGGEEQLLDDALIRIGLARLRLGEAERAIEALTTLLARFPQSTHALQAMFEIAQAQVSLGQDAEAEAMFARVLEAGADSRFAPYCLDHLGAIAMAGGRYDEAAEHYRNLAMLRESGAAEALLSLGRAQLAAGDFEGAVGTLDRAIDGAQDGVLLRARAYRAIALARLDRTAEAEVEIAALLADAREGLGEDLVRSLRYERAWSLREMGRGEEAIEAYREMLVDQPRDATRAHALLDLAGLEMDASRHERAIEPLIESLDIARGLGLDDGVIAQAEYRLGVARFRVGQAAEASEMLATFPDRHPGSVLRASAGLIAGEALFQLGRFERASEVLRRVAEEHPADEAAPSAMLRLGECEAALQRWARSEEVFSRYLERHAASPLAFQARFGLAWARENQGRYDEAIAGYREVAATHRGPTAARAQFQIGECLFAKRLHAEAVTEFLRVDILYGVDEWTAAALYEAGRCFEAMQKVGEAREQYAQVTSRFGESDWARLARERLDALAQGSRRGG